MIRRLVTGGALAVALALPLAGCGAAGDAAPSPVATTQVDLPPSYRFEPEAITVPAGSTVTWTNSDNFTHSVQLTGGDPDDPDDPDDPRLMEPGATASITFDSPGTYPYQCHLHPTDMRGTVTVTP